MENLVIKAYPAAAKEMVAVLRRGYFVDALQNLKLLLYMKQTHLEDMRSALSRALEMKPYTTVPDEMLGMGIY